MTEILAAAGMNELLAVNTFQLVLVVLLIVVIVAYVIYYKKKQE